MMKYSIALEKHVAALRPDPRFEDRVHAEAVKLGMWKPTDVGPAEQNAIVARKHLARAETFYLSADIFDAIDVSSRALPDVEWSNSLWASWPYGFMWLETPFVINPSEAWGRALPVVALGWYPSTDNEDRRPACEVVSFGELAGRLITPMYTQLIEGGSVAHLAEHPDVEPGATIVRIGRLVTAMFLWMNQRLLVTAHEQAERHARKRAAAISPEIASRGIHVIQLRRTEARGGAAGDGPVEWSCQWIVCGHWRRQFHPSTGERAPMWIVPHVKGPADKPLKTPRPTVFAVVR